jgi:hypothetical protein
MWCCWIFPDRNPASTQRLWFQCRSSRSNSYPFQPRQVIDWLFTTLLVVLLGGVAWVFAQMYRDSILSHITRTTPNQLGIDFYIRIISFGALPLLTWLAYHFPDVGGAIFKIFQPGTEVVK